VLTVYLLSLGMLAQAETMTLELFEVPESLQPEPQAGAIEIEADKLDLYLDRKMRATGNAMISQGNQKIYGDTIEYDILNDELTVEGSARIDLGDSEITGPSLTMRLSESIGEMTEASVTLRKK